MTFAIITHADHFIEEERYYGYAPYVKEMNIWCKFIDKLIIIAPISNKKRSAIHTDYSFNNITFISIPAISITSFVESIRAICYFPVIAFRIFRVMQKADHIHLRCPGNIGLIGCMVQILFPRKPKTAKYAGNWDPKAKQPKSYRIQKWLLSSTFWTKNMQVLVYGDWPDQSKNIKPFFTATYTESMIVDIPQRQLSPPFKFLFVGTLSPGKRPLYCVKIIEALLNKGIDINLDIYGEGTERDALEAYIQKKELNDTVVLRGNQSSEIVEKAYRNSDLLLLPSKSEGWPKAVAEAMFWGCVPLVTKVSCVPWMLGEGRRGVLLEADLDKDIAQIKTSILDTNKLREMSKEGQKWSHEYTLDYFEAEIKTLLS
jgi:glycosyltransferase involved in cell wall biosynthesis